MLSLRTTSYSHAQTLIISLLYQLLALVMVCGDTDVRLLELLSLIDFFGRKNCLNIVTFTRKCLERFFPLIPREKKKCLRLTRESMKFAPENSFTYFSSHKLSLLLSTALLQQNPGGSDQYLVRDLGVRATSRHWRKIIARPRREKV